MSNQEEWNIAHILNNIHATGSVPPDRKDESWEILSAIVSAHINQQRQLLELKDSYITAIATMRDTHDSINRGDLLRAKTLMIAPEELSMWVHTEHRLRRNVKHLVAIIQQARKAIRDNDLLRTATLLEANIKYPPSAAINCKHEYVHKYVRVCSHCKEME